MFYNVNIKCVAKVLKVSRRYLLWIQNSVFEGEITLGRPKSLKGELGKIIDDGEDSILFYIVFQELYLQRISWNEQGTH